MQAMQAEEDMRKRNMSRKELMAKYRPTRPVTMSPQQLASYDINRVKKLQRYLKSFLMVARFKNLGSRFLLCFSGSATLSDCMRAVLQCWTSRRHQCLSSNAIARSFCLRLSPVRSLMSAPWSRR
jgi:hypothetical protein